MRMTQACLWLSAADRTTLKGEGRVGAVAATTWIRVCEDNTDALASKCGDHEFTLVSTAYCGACEHWAAARRSRQFWRKPDDDEAVPLRHGSPVQKMINFKMAICASRING